MAQQPQAALDFYADQQQRKLATLVVVGALWSKIEPLGNWSEQFGSLSVLMGTVIGQAQEAIARRAQAYADQLAAEMGLSGTRGHRLNPAGFGGWNGDGRTAEQALGAAVAHAGKTYSEAKAFTPPAEFDIEAEAKAALARARILAETITSTMLADAARAAASVDMTGRPAVGGYIRMLTPPSCSRCVVMAGKFYRWNMGFERHPKCDCIHVPAVEDNLPNDMLTNPHTYFHSLDEAEQNKVFGKAGAQAIRDGADISQVVNARSGMRKAQDLSGRNVKITLDGTTKSAWFGGGYAARKYGDTDWFKQFGYAKAEGRRRTTALRLMPESIYDLASDRDEAIRLLKRYGFFL